MPTLTASPARSNALTVERNRLASWDGGVWASAANRAGWGQNTKEYDAASELTYMYQRWYDPALGIFTSAAPYPPMIEHPYTFAEGNPVMRFDPRGELPGFQIAAGWICGYYGAGIANSSKPFTAANTCEYWVQSATVHAGMAHGATVFGIMGGAIGLALGGGGGAAAGTATAPGPATIAGAGFFGTLGAFIGSTAGSCFGGGVGGFVGHRAGAGLAPIVCNALACAGNAIMAGLRKVFESGGGGANGPPMGPVANIAGKATSA